MEILPFNLIPWTSLKIHPPLINYRTLLEIRNNIPRPSVKKYIEKMEIFTRKCEQTHEQMKTKLIIFYFLNVLFTQIPQRDNIINTISPTTSNVNLSPSTPCEVLEETSHIKFMKNQQTTRTKTSP